MSRYTACDLFRAEVVVMVLKLPTFKGFQIQIVKVLREIILKLALAVSSFTFILLQLLLQLFQQNADFSAILYFVLSGETKDTKRDIFCH